MNDDGVRGPPPLEIVFSFNIAGAYGPMHPTSKAYLKNLFHSFGNTQLLQKIFSINSSSETRVAVFAHGFHKNMEGIQSLDFTDGVTALRRFVATTSDMKWGAREHCYELVLRKAQWLSWTPGSKRALVLIGCTRPHDGSHVGSVERIHWRLEARCLAQMGIAVYAVEVKLKDDATDFYREVAEITEGCHVTLEQCTPLDDVVTAIVSHLVSSETMEEFEQEVINQADDHYTSDMAQLFVSLRHHGDDLVTSLGTPQASDFDDDSDENYEDDDLDVDKMTSSGPEITKVTSSEREVTQGGELSSWTVPEPSAKTGVKTPRLKKCQTAPVSIRNCPEKKEATMAVLGSVDCEAETRVAGNPRKRASLRRGMTAGFLDGGGGAVMMGGGGDFGRNGDDHATDVYKIDREAPVKRENISPRTFTLRHLSWSPWKLVISPTLPSSAGTDPDDWEPRSGDSNGGYRRKSVSAQNNNECAALYELALKTEGTGRKRVVFFKFLSELVDDTSWEDQLLSRNWDLRQKVGEAVGGKKCSVFLRLAPLAQTGLGGRAQKIVQAALHKYDYAWNDCVQGLRRSRVRRVEFY